MIKILFIEDDPDQLMMYDFKFQEQGLLVIPAADADEAWGVVSDGEPDLILLDIMLKNENGLDILEKLRKDKRFLKTPVIVFTNYDKEEFRERAKKFHALDYIIKSQTTPQEMADKIKKFVETGKYEKREE
jgi:DNA-binding response OmpR family regulator